MTSVTTSADVPHVPVSEGRPKLDHPVDMRQLLVFFVILAGGLLFTAYSIYSDVSKTGGAPSNTLPYVLLAVALLIALAFEFVNGFHDTANAVATVIYTHALPATIAVPWSGLWNFLGVLWSSGAVAFGIVSLLPVELILNVGSGAGFAMVFAMLIAAIIWNFGTWFLGLPASSSHTLIGSIIGVGVANALLQGRDGTSGVDWGQAANVGYALLLSPIVGFVCSGALLLLLKNFVHRPELFEAPKSDKPPAPWVRGLLIFTCTGVSFFHGSNDGQKGMGLIMLILIGVVPTTYALNRHSDTDTKTFLSSSAAAFKVLETKAQGHTADKDPSAAVTKFVASHKPTDDTYASLLALGKNIDTQLSKSGSLANVSGAEPVHNMRNDMYLESEAVRLFQKEKIGGFTADELKPLGDYKKKLDEGIKFIPTWVKIVVALALGLGTMIGWKRIVVTVGEKIGKTHLTYGQGASAELVAMGTIFAADSFGLPVSTTHVLSSGVAGTMAANGSGVQLETIRNIALAWVLTLPVAMLLSGTLYFIFHLIVT